MRHPLFASVCWLIGAHCALAADAIPDPDPEIERKSLQVAEGFEVNLWAADPLLAKPIQINFDAAGRLWVASSEIYPQVKPGEVADDKVLVLEDTDGDGSADKTTIFARGLLIPTGVQPGDGGAYVANSTEMVYFSDIDGDLKADERRVVLSGFGTEDTHHIIHTFRWGYDSALYFDQSIYIHSHVETPWGPRRLNGGGTWRFRPESMQLEVFTRGLVNPWGHHWDEWGATFLTDGAGGEGINYAFPGVVACATPGVARVLPGLNPGSPKFCGLEVVSGRHVPEDWRGSLITNDFRAHRVCRFVVTEDGSGFASREQAEVIKSAHPAFRPIDVKMGPDGAIYIADWYNPIINHGEVDFRDPRRDHVHGRIWRVTAKGRPLVARPKLVGVSTEELLAYLKAPEEFTRLHAKRQLKERGTQVVPAVAAWVKGLDPQDSQHEHNLLEALWVYEGLDIVEPQLLETLLSAKDFHARAAATRTLGHWVHRVPNANSLLARQVMDEHPRVRLEAVCATRSLESPQAIEIALGALDRPVDRFIDYALWITVRDLQPLWLPALQAGSLNFGVNTKHLTFALEAAGNAGVIGPLVNLLQTGQVPTERRQSILVLITALGGPKELQTVWELANAGATAPALRADLLAALANAAEQRKLRPSGEIAQVAQLLAAEDEDTRVAAIKLSGIWKVEATRPTLAQLAASDQMSAAMSQAAFEALSNLGGPASRDALAKIIDTSTSFAKRSAAVTAIARIDLSLAAAAAVRLLETATTNDDPTAMIAAIVDQKEGTAALANALAGKKLSDDVAKIALRAARSVGREEPTLVTAFMSAGKLTSGNRTFTPDELKQFVADVASQGNPERGEAVFRRTEQACLKCHAVGDAGGQVGPNLQSIGASAPVDYLVESLLQPRAKIKEGYHSINVVTDEGKVHSGIKVSESDSQLILRDAEDRVTVIPKALIDEQSQGGSLMPIGLTDTLTRTELVDLVRFLSELGRVGGQYAIGTERLVRRWRVLTDSPEARGMFKQEEINLNAVVWNPSIWRAGYSAVSGWLPLAEVPLFESAGVPAKLGVVRFEMDVSSRGALKLKLDPTLVKHAWVDSTPVEVKEEIDVDLVAARHTVTLVLDGTQPQAALRVELLDVPGSPAQAQIVGGK